MRVILAVLILAFAGCTTPIDSINTAQEQSMQEDFAAVTGLALLWQEDAYFYEAIATELQDHVRDEYLANATKGAAIRGEYEDQAIGDGRAPVWEYRFYSDTLGAVRAFVMSEGALLAEFDEKPNAKPLQIGSFIDSTDVMNAHGHLVGNVSLLTMRLGEQCDAAYWMILTKSDAGNNGFFVSANGNFGPLGALGCAPGGIQEFGSDSLQLQLGNPDSFQFELLGEYHHGMNVVIEPVNPTVPGQTVSIAITNATGTQRTFDYTTGQGMAIPDLDGGDGEWAVFAELVQGVSAELTVHWCTDGFPMDADALQNPACQAS